VDILLSDATLSLVYSSIPRYNTATATTTTPQIATYSPEDAARFLKIHAGAFILHATYGARGIRPWWMFVFESLADAAVRAL
jgi:hypothetical protein